MPRYHSPGLIRELVEQQIEINVAMQCHMQPFIAEAFFCNSIDIIISEIRVPAQSCSFKSHIAHVDVRE